MNFRRTSGKQEVSLVNLTRCDYQFEKLKRA